MRDQAPNEVTRARASCHLVLRLFLLFAAVIHAGPAHSGPPRDAPERGYLTTGVLRRQPPDTCLVLVNFKQIPPALLDTYDAFAEGDTVVVTGDLPVNLPNLFCGVEFWIHHNRVFPYRGVIDLECGVLVDDDPADCGYFDSFRFGRFHTGMGPPFSDGDSVHVWGRFHNDWYTWCFSDYPETEVTHIIACPDTSTAIQPTTWGRLRVLFR